MNKALPALLTIALAFMAGSCGSVRRAASGSATDSTALAIPDSSLARADTAFVRMGPVGPLPDTGFRDESPGAATIPGTGLSSDALLEALLPYAIPDTTWTTFNARAKLHVEGGGQSHDISANIRMEQGKSIWVSATALLNFEVGRLLITPDTVWLLDRLNRTATVLPFSEIGQLLPLQTDFYSLQSLITGGVVRTGHTPDRALDTGTNLMLLSLAPDFLQALQFSKADTGLRLQYIATPESSMLCEYDDPGLRSGHRFPARRNLRLNDRGAQYRLTMEFIKADFDTPVELPFSIPASYQRR